MPLIEIGIVLVLILVNGILAMSEMAIVSSRRTRLAGLAERGSRGARAALGLIDDPSRFLSTVQIGITLVGIVAGAFGGATIAGTLGDWLNRVSWIAPNGPAIAIAVVVVAITYLSLVVGELVPKRIALANPERTAALVAPAMRILSRIAAPAVWILRHSTDGILRRFGLSGVRATTITEDEVRSLIAEGTRAGVFVPEERKMIDAVLRLADRSVRAIMTPRAEVAWIDAAAGRDEVVDAFRRQKFSQLLVCDGSIDQAMGIIDAREALIAPADRTFRIADILRRAPVVPEQAPVLRLIDQFRRSGVHFAIIVDEYGATEGVVTSTDVLESLAGDLPERGEAAEPMVVRRADGSWLVDGMLAIDEFEELVGGRKLRGDGDYETVAGFVIDRLGRMPEAGDRVAVDDLTFEVVDMDGRRIDKLLVTKAAEPEFE